MEEIEEVAAEVEQSREIAVRVVPASITADFDAVEEKVSKLLSDYEGVTAEGIAKMDLSEMKAERAYLNKVRDQLDEAKRAVRREYEKPYKDFEANVKRIIAMVDAPNETIKACIEDKERAIKQERKSHLERVYAAFLEDNGLPSLAGVLGFDRVCDPRWWDTTAKDWKPGKHEGELCDRVAAVLAEWRSFQGVRPKLYDPAYAEGVFWETLKASEAINADTAENDRRNAIAAARRDLGAEEPQREPAPMPGRRPQQAPEQQETRTYTIRCSMTDAQRAALMAFFKANGITGKIRKER